MPSGICGHSTANPSMRAGRSGPAIHSPALARTSPRRATWASTVNRPPSVRAAGKLATPAGAAAWTGTATGEAAGRSQPQRGCRAAELAQHTRLERAARRLRMHAHAKVGTRRRQDGQAVARTFEKARPRIWWRDDAEAARGRSGSNDFNDGRTIRVASARIPRQNQAALDRRVSLFVRKALRRLHATTNPLAE